MFGYTGLKLKAISYSLLICLLLFSPYNSQNNPISEEMKYQPFSQSVLHMNQLLMDPYWKISSSIIIGYDSNFTDYGFPGNGTKENPYLIENLSITTSESIGIYIFNTAKHFVIKDCYISAVDIGIVLNNISTSTASVINTTCCYHTIYGLFLDSSNDATIYNNNFHHNIGGLGLYNSSYGNITSNSCHSNGYVDIYLIESDYSLIQYNQCTNTRFGLGILNCQFSEISNNDLDIHESSIRIVSSSFINITNNNCFFNNFGGISIDSSSDILIFNNICVYSSYGIFIERSTNFTIKQNDCSKGFHGIDLDYCCIFSVLNNTCTGYTR
ncbi:MAG: right-handed parallel beta-helix repeat-containing protein, partial [Candidatus Heimdallarchaeota archaeon]|nr:right-handed parallel beta-helix repeat-containing protein [Candidatus Heimdallarchaeota archaeon]